MPLASPPEKMTMRLPLNALCTTCLTRSASVADRDLVLLVDLLGLGLLDVGRRRLDLDDVRAELGGDLRGVARMTSIAVSPSLESPAPRG